MNTYSTRHPIGIVNDKRIHIDGFEDLVYEDCFSIMAAGHRYLDYGIADGSILLCSQSVVPQEEDIVLTDDNGVMTLYLFRPTSKEKTDGKKRVLSDRSRIKATVLGSFNYYR
jgi:hypothetical protein